MVGGFGISVKPGSTAGVYQRGRPKAMQTAVSLDNRDGDMTLSIDIGDELVERIAERAAELVAHKQDETKDDGWLRGADKIAALHRRAPVARLRPRLGAANPGPPRRVGPDRAALRARRLAAGRWRQAILKQGQLQPVSSAGTHPRVSRLGRTCEWPTQEVAWSDR